MPWRVTRGSPQERRRIPPDPEIGSRRIHLRLTRRKSPAKNASQRPAWPVLSPAAMNRTSNVRSSLRGLASSSLLLAALPLVVGCGAGDDLEDIDARGDEINPIYGVDYSWARPSPAHLKAEGYQFAARYLSYDTSGKNITAGEANALRAAGIDVVSNWEQGASDALAGYQRGVEHAKAAEAKATAAGMPAGRPIYFSCDFDASPAQQGAINSYMDGVASVIGRGRTGGYGGYYLIKRLFDAGKITWGWQTYAWSGGQWDPRAQVRQIQNGLEGGSIDKDQAMAADYGQWGGSGGGQPPAPQGPPTAAPPAPTGCGTIQPGHGLAAGQSFSSCDGRFSLAMQTDGNLVLYHNGAGALWSTHSNGSDGFAAVMQGDGNFVLYGKHSNALWDSDTDGHGGATLAVQDDGNLVVYAPGGKALWASNTVVPPPPPTPPPPPAGCTIMNPGQQLSAGQQFSSCDGHHTLAMQTDGNLVLYHNGVGAIWATGTNGKGGHTAVMQGDGNFVLYNAANHPLWASNTNGHGGAHLAVQDDGNLVVYASGGAALWNTHTNGK
jgi:hypothetical protein